MTLKHTLASKKLDYEYFVRSQKEKEKDSKSLKKLELQTKMARETLANVKLQHENLLSQASDHHITSHRMLFCI